MNLSNVISQTIEENIVQEETTVLPIYEDPDGTYTRTYTSFGGADIVIYCHGEALGEAQSYSVDESTNVLTIDFTIFEINRINEYIELLNEYGRALVRYMNEYGNQMFVVIEGITFNSRRYRHSIDDVALIITAQFDFESLTMFPGRPDETYADILPNNFFT